MRVSFPGGAKGDREEGSVKKIQPGGKPQGEGSEAAGQVADPEAWPRAGD